MTVKEEIEQQFKGYDVLKCNYCDIEMGLVSPVGNEINVFDVICTRCYNKKLRGEEE